MTTAKRSYEEKKHDIPWWPPGDVKPKKITILLGDY
jgi:hypothetical protein